MASGGDFAAEVTWRQLGPVLTEYFPHGHEGTRGLKIVEVGCGMGELSFLMQEAGHTVVAIDPSAEAIAATRKKGVTDARQCGLEDLAKVRPLPSSFFVLFACNSVS
jgi:2-polyprenyl-3-methyl-5-hydroxy-6-metoxy-1,4-benzoquinol methylase